MNPETEYRASEDFNASLAQPLVYLDDQINRYKRKMPSDVFLKLQNESQTKLQNQLKKVLRISKADPEHEELVKANFNS